MTTKPVEELILNLKNNPLLPDYKEYWDSITPKTDEEIENRWIFAYLSVHAPWSTNVSSYLLLKANKEAWRNNRSELRKLLEQSKIGLYNTRERGIWELVSTPIKQRRNSESWVDFRDRVEKKLYGLGPAKTAFAIEMCYPLECRTVCLDTHMLQLYGYDTKDVGKANSGKKYKEIEYHWLKCCEKNEIEPYMARCLFWDQRQMQTSSKYWSDVLV